MKRQNFDRANEIIQKITKLEDVVRRFEKSERVEISFLELSAGGKYDIATFKIHEGINTAIAKELVKVAVDNFEDQIHKLQTELDTL